MDTNVNPDPANGTPVPNVGTAAARPKPRGKRATLAAAVVSAGLTLFGLGLAAIPFVAGALGHPPTKEGLILIAVGLALVSVVVGLLLVIVVVELLVAFVVELWKRLRKRPGPIMTTGFAQPSCAGVPTIPNPAPSEPT